MLGGGEMRMRRSVCLLVSALLCTGNSLPALAKVISRSRKSDRNLSFECGVPKSGVSSARGINAFVNNHQFRIGQGVTWQGVYLFKGRNWYSGDSGSDVAPQVGNWAAEEGRLCLQPSPERRYCWSDIRISRKLPCMVGKDQWGQVLTFRKTY
jgi:hypothetical protein